MIELSLVYGETLQQKLTLDGGHEIRFPVGMEASRLGDHLFHTR
jgi:hypothetical protein